MTSLLYDSAPPGQLLSRLQRVFPAANKIHPLVAAEGFDLVYRAFPAGILV